MTQKKGIVVCCDGTRNTFGRPDTNVRRVFDALDDKNYYRYYDTGLGTDSMWRDSIVAGTVIDRVSNGLANGRGTAFAMGQHRKVLDAYRFLCRRYDTGQKIFLFGFSRGAWCVRRLAKMVAVIGLLPRDFDHLVPMAYDAYTVFKEIEKGKEKRSSVYESFRKLKCLRHPEFVFVGVWDTVRSDGLSRNIPGCSFVRDTKRTQLQGRHALALDERRLRFEPELWNNDPRVKQRWFPGDHSDVGGGNLGRPASKRSRSDIVTEETDLSYLSLVWLCREAERCELELNIDEFLKHERLVRGNLWQKRSGVSDKSSLKPWSPWNVPVIRSSRTRRLMSTEYKSDCDPAVQARLDAMGEREAEGYIEGKDPDRNELKPPSAR